MAITFRGTPSDAPGAIQERRRVHVHGVVQGVGFRPFVWRLARDNGLCGLVRNTSGAVVIELEGEPQALDRAIGALTVEAPPLARISDVAWERIPLLGETGFRIESSLAVVDEYQPISPDAATCAECVRELFDPADRRHRYPFVNCTNCGPRFTIIEDIPYDRPLTTMRVFDMCEPCRREYEDPADRRFHAQPVACAVCGPRLWLADRAGAELPGEAITTVADAILGGAIVALKGLGGFQLACDARDEGVVARLRERKRRPAKPFALMVASLGEARSLCEVGEEEAAVLGGTVGPIVLLRRRAGSTGVAEGVAPGLDELGLMLPSTPLHHLLLDAVGGAPLVMTSGNVSDEPIAKDNAEAVERLGEIADLFLLHDRGIHARYDDSVVRVDGAETRVIRRARGLCPEPVDIGDGAGEIVAFGAHLKNTFAVVRDGRAFVGPHIGDLDDARSVGHQGEALTTYLRLFRARPRTAVCDLHPDYTSTRLAERWAAERLDDPGAASVVRVQHHHAHVASVMAEHGLRGEVIGVALDGTGFGPDGTIWGGEFLVADERRFLRAGHLAPVRQPGGDLCAREGWRMLAAYLAAAGEAVDAPPEWLAPGGAPDERRWRLVTRLAASEMAPLTSSAGRLFDGVASLVGVAHTSSYEAEAAIRLEALARRVPVESVDAYPVDLGDSWPVVVDAPRLVARMAADRARGRAAAEIAAAFHATLARTIVAVCDRVRAETGLARVALSGGVFQNAILLGRTSFLLAEGGFMPYTNVRLPANDGGISLGQALVAASLAGSQAGR